ncbi:MAG TPA: hypothetical protein VM943_09495 [Pyrinomonadaceae bacterium]|nr:hypothetical protein [Pyrinomonadaceae bacterium]
MLLSEQTRGEIFRRQSARRLRLLVFCLVAFSGSALAQDQRVGDTKDG